MACSVHLRRFLAVLLCCVLAFHSALPVARAAEPVSASLAIAGGAVALAGVSGAAITNTIGPQVAAIVGTTMEGLGTSVYTAESSAKTKTQFIMEKIAVWCLKAKMAKEDFYKRVAQGVSVAANGTIQLSKDAAGLISQFVSSLYESGEVVSSPGESSGFPSSSSSLSLNISQPFEFLDSNFSIFDNSGAVEQSFSMDSDVFCTIFQSKNYDTVNGYLIFSSAFSGRSVVSSTGYTYPLTSTYTYDNKLVYYSAYRNTSSAYYRNCYAGLPCNLSLSNNLAGREYIAWATVFGDVVNPDVNLPYDEVFTGSSDTWAENKDLLNPAGDDVTTVSPDVYSSLLAQMEQGQVATMGINTYLDSLVSAFDGLKAQVAELTDAVTGTSTSVAVPDTVTSEVSVDPVAPGVVPVVDPVELNPDGTIESFSFPLDEIFPFCIPFDVAAALSLFDVPAEAPALHVHWDLPYNIVFDFDLDLSAYDDIAALLRTMETILFCVGLAVATRAIFLRS